MIAGLTAELYRFVPDLRRRLAQLSIVSLAASLAEAVALVLVARVAVGLAGNNLDDFDLPFIGASVSEVALLAVAAVLAVANLGLHLVEATYRARLNADVVVGSRRAALTAFAGAVWAQQAREREGALQETVTTLTTQAGNLMLTIASYLTAGLHLAVLLSVACIVDPVSTAAVIAFGAVLFLALRPIARLTERRATDWVVSNSDFAETVSGLSTLAMELRVFGAHARAQEQLDELNRVTGAKLERMRATSGFGGTLYRDIALLLLTGAIAILLNVTDELVVSFGIVALLILRSVGSAQRVQAALQAARELRPSVDSLNERIRLLATTPEPPRQRPADHLGAIDLEGVSYDYGDERNTLTDLDLSINAGEVLGVVGPSGSGKSTLAQLLLRLRLPTQGRILVGGVEYDTIADSDWTRLVALVPQEPRLLEASIADNIRFFRDGYDSAAVERAARDALLSDDLRRLPAGLETVVGPRGGGLSGGQRQRVTIARALLGEPELLVLDEPTSALDGRSERLLNQTIAGLRGSTTLVIIAHRLTTLESCDRIAVIADGQLTQIGTREALAAEPGFYQSVLEALRQG